MNGARAQYLYGVIVALQPGTPCAALASVGHLFRQMRGQHMQMSIVIDEYGGTAGMVTLEELVEEIVGRLTDEWVTEQLLVELDGQTVQIHGLMRIDEVNRELSIALPEDDHYDTIAGFLLYHLRCVPEEGEKLSYGDMELTVLEMKGPKIEKVLIKRDLRCPLGSGRSSP
jgi:CBS domain containing-hemolysin-like protein